MKYPYEILKIFNKHFVFTLLVLFCGSLASLSAADNIEIELHKDTTLKINKCEINALVSGGLQPSSTQSNRLRNVEESRNVEKINKLDVDFFSDFSIPVLLVNDKGRTLHKKYIFSSFRFPDNKLFEIYCAWKLHCIS
ncbi:MAG TPA: hypothetical protein VK169_19625 [Saprospiraceae bacterium]|nr:hypothetical protein [Saprospiraceae bacterium]